MTKNQIEYQKSEEAKRANRAAEAENQRSHKAQEAEMNRSNLAREFETNRSNLANEQLKRYDVDQRTAASKYSADSAAQASGLAATLAHDSALYAADSNYAASNYRADRAYQGTVDSAYVHKWGVDATTARDLGKGVAKGVSSAINSPGFIKPGLTVMGAPKTAVKVGIGLINSAGNAVSNLANSIKEYMKR